MSTHAFIGVVENTGTLKYVYNHSDGYPSYLGKMLLEHYNTPELATALVNLGDISMVRERLAPDEGRNIRSKTLYERDLKAALQPHIIATEKTPLKFATCLLIQTM